MEIMYVQIEDKIDILKNKEDMLIINKKVKALLNSFLFLLSFASSTTIGGPLNDTAPFKIPLKIPAIIYDRDLFFIFNFTPLNMMIEIKINNTLTNNFNVLSSTNTNI